ncbi:probable prolyl 4-hydroxylase 10 [Patiria miniata]|uniref:Prolyl 4-hydroxylase alpha subunit domain-containing protein n=1 Tax=Patiria miniata TaxID=46514 RepID=A0A914AWB9_PATMI|nr:probable prolyl 4-hydroxylase 10 [Patiria miniata]
MASDMETVDLTRTLKVLSKNSKRPRPVKTNIIPPGAKEGEKTAFFLDNVFTKEECKELIRRSEEKGYEQALVNIGGGRQKLMLSARNNQRCLIDSTELVDAFWERLAEFIPQPFYGYKALGLNERLRFLRYDPGEYFKPHFDGSYERKNGEHSMVTVQIYLNEGFKGGSTTFLPYFNSDDDPPVECVPKIGRVLIFEHRLYHEGSMLKDGRKYAIRTDVMYSSEKQDDVEHEDPYC